MKFYSLVAITTLALCFACQGRKGNSYYVPPNVVALPTSKWSPEKGYISTPKFEKAVEVAKKVFKEKCGDFDPNSDVTYSVTEKEGTIRVFMIYCSGYDKNGEGVHFVGGHGTVTISDDFKDIHYHPGY